MDTKPHISVCICTYNRSKMLEGLLHELAKQETNGLFDYSITIVDNDSSESAREVVTLARATTGLPVRYEVEPEQNIALARNKAVRSADGDFIAFIDDDELPVSDWLLQLYQACQDVDGVLGPVKPRFCQTPPAWAVRAGIFDRPNSGDYPAGTKLHWSQTGMGNVLLKRTALSSLQTPFLREFGSGGEDIDFFRRAMENGKVFIWCPNAIAYEIVPVERTGVSFQLRRALLRGKASLASPAGRPLGVLKSLSAFVLYALCLPVSLILGRHVFLKNLIKSCDHLGKILAACGIDIVREKYVLN
jgi:succinoglycan biosynthesis protein ExoM